MSYKGPFATLLAGSAVTAVLVGLSFRAGPGPQPAAAAGTQLPSVPAATALLPDPPGASSTPARPAAPKRPAAVNASWAGKVAGSRSTLAIAVTNGTAVAYLCDGNQIEEWLRGTAADGQLRLSAVKGGGSLTGTFRADRAQGTVTEASRARAFDIAAVSAPSGLYRSAAKLRNASVVGGWIVLADGRQVGLASVDGTPVRPSTLDVGAGTATVSGDSVHADRLGGDG
jgi:hypothetical protein